MAGENVEVWTHENDQSLFYTHNYNIWTSQKLYIKQEGMATLCHCWQVLLFTVCLCYWSVHIYTITQNVWRRLNLKFLMITDLLSSAFAVQLQIVWILVRLHLCLTLGTAGVYPDVRVDYLLLLKIQLMKAHTLWR